MGFCICELSSNIRWPTYAQNKIAWPYIVIDCWYFGNKNRVGISYSHKMNVLRDHVHKKCSAKQIDFHHDRSQPRERLQKLIRIQQRHSPLYIHFHSVVWIHLHHRRNLLMKMARYVNKGKWVERKKKYKIVEENRCSDNKNNNANIKF